MGAPVRTARTTAAVSLERLSKHFKSVPAVDDVSFEIHEGEVFTLLGPSGCGKTTTLRMIAGLEEPTEGRVLFRDKVVVDARKGIFVAPERRNVGMVFQSYAIWPHMTVYENVAYPLKLRGIKGDQARSRVSKILAILGLEGLEDRPAPMLSGGQQQRVALGRALVYEPELLLLDEPFSNLDAKLREHFRLELKLLQRRLGVTVVFVTHDQIEALSLSDRIAVMNGGRVEQLGQPHEVYEKPASSFVRDFLGRTVLLRGEVRESSGTGHVVIGLGDSEGVLMGRTVLGGDMQPGQTVHVAMRPEDLEITSPMGDWRVNILSGTVEALLYVGDRQEVDVKLRDNTRILCYAPRWAALREGEAVHLKVREDCMTIWPA
jgi:ABC-type Fe3+/spermidine/putrescine transport system ATPase subunit